MKRYSILLVDDEEIVLKTMYLELQDRGYDVAMAENGDAAVEKLQAEYYDLVVTDLVMEGMNGLQLLRKVKQIRPETMTLVLTGYSDWGSSIDILREHADEYLLKPCQKEEVCFRISRCLEKLELQRKVQEYESRYGEITAS